MWNRFDGESIRVPFSLRSPSRLLSLSIISIARSQYERGGSVAEKATGAKSKRRTLRWSRSLAASIVGVEECFFLQRSDLLSSPDDDAFEASVLPLFLTLVAARQRASLLSATEGKSTVILCR